MVQKVALDKALNNLIASYSGKIATFNVVDFLKTGVDPFRFTFNVSVWGLEEAVRKEIEHKIEMALENLVGDFHENYLGRVKHIPTDSQWVLVPEGSVYGIDIANVHLNRYYQIKSKHNSMNSSSSAKLANELEKLAKDGTNKEVGCMWIIAKQGNKAIGENIICEVANCIKGNQTYDYVTGQENEIDAVLEYLYQKIPVLLVVGGLNFDVLLTDAVERVTTSLNDLATASGKTVIDIIKERSID